MNTKIQTPVKPEVGMGATLHYPQDSYPFVIVRVSPSGKTAEVAPLKTVDKTTGHEPAYFNGPFPVWSHTYTEEELQSMRDWRTGTRTIRLLKNGRWSFKGTPFSIGSARYHRDYSN